MHVNPVIVVMVSTGTPYWHNNAC